MENHKESKKQVNLTLKNVVVFHNHIFDLGKSNNPTEISRKLLKTGFVRSAINYNREDVEIAKRFNDLLKLRKRAEKLLLLNRYLKKGKFSDIVSFFILHPEILFLIQKAKKDSKMSNEIDKKKRSTEEIIQDAIQFVDEAMANNVQAFQALHLYVDKDVFSPIYISEVPFTRLNLEPFYAKVAEEELAIDVNLLIHRTGVAIITFYIMFNESKSTNDLIRFKNNIDRNVETLEIVKPIIDLQSYSVSNNKLNYYPYQTRFSSGLEWLQYSELKNITLNDVFDLYKTAILKITTRSIGNNIDTRQNYDWLIYPIFFIRDVEPICHTEQEFKDKFLEELLCLIQGNQRKWLKKENTKEILSRDFSSTTDHCFYISASHALVIYYEGFKEQITGEKNKEPTGNQWIIHHFYSSCIIDLLLIQRWIFHLLDKEARKLPNNLAKLNSLRKNLVLALDEYYSNTVSYGEVQDIIKQGQRIMDISSLYNAIMVKIENLSRLIDVIENKKQNLRSRFLQIGISFISLLLGLSTAKQVVDVISLWEKMALKENESFTKEFAIKIYNGIIDFVVIDKNLATLKLYGIIILLFFVIIIITLVSKRDKSRIIIYDQSKPARKLGFKWPTNIEFAVFEDEGD